MQVFAELNSVGGQILKSLKDRVKAKLAERLKVDNDEEAEPPVEEYILSSAQLELIDRLSQKKSSDVRDAIRLISSSDLAVFSKAIEVINKDFESEVSLLLAKMPDPLLEKAVAEFSIKADRNNYGVFGSLSRADLSKESFNKILALVSEESLTAYANTRDVIPHVTKIYQKYFIDKLVQMDSKVWINYFVPTNMLPYLIISHCDSSSSDDFKQICFTKMDKAHSSFLYGRLGDKLQDYQYLVCYIGARMLLKMPNLSLEDIGERLPREIR